MNGSPSEDCVNLLPSSAASRIMSAPSVSLYIHVPFCTRKCDYCHFFVLPDKDPLKKDYMRGLRQEWELNRNRLHEYTLSTIYFGGGTPSLLGPEKINEILQWIRTVHWESKEIEITLEANPENISTPLMKEYADAGINRVSVGVQSLDDSNLKILTRTHSALKAAEAIFQIRDAGISNISIDLMYDLPGQTYAHWTRTLDSALQLPITHLSLYNLVFENHTVFHKRRAQLQRLLPDDKASTEMFREACARCDSAGLRQYEISAFAKSGFQAKHNTGYWTGHPFLGLGPSAFSYWKGKRYRNVSHLGKYIKQLEERGIAIDYEEELQGQDKVRELLAIHLRLIEGVDLEAFQSLHGCLDETTLQPLQKLTQEGYLEQSFNRVRLTRKGILFYDSVATEII